jgi:hypothetical protein
MTAVGTALGRAAGWAAAPFFAAVSFARRARTFHPRGPVFHAEVSPHATVPSHLRALGERLSGPALVRFSGALWKKTESVPDVLGCALRVRRTKEETAEPAGDDQDLLFATIRRPWTMPFSPLTTNRRDYLANDYFAVSPFDVGLEHDVYLRLHPERHSTTHEGTRSDRLARAVMRGEARLVLEAAQKPFGPWTPVAAVVIERDAAVDGEALRYRPFREGRGVRPRGFVHALRKAVYPASQSARPDHGK